MKLNLHEIGSDMFRCYLLETPVGWIALDTGYPGKMARYRKRFSKLAPIDQIRYVFLTHAHDDHAGFLGELLKESGATLVLSEKSLPILASGENAVPEGAGFASRAGYLFSIVKKTHSFPPFVPDASTILIKSELDQPFRELGLPLRVVQLPGHTTDSIGLFLEETGDLLCGDAAMNSPISPARHTIWIDDPAEFGRSWDRMLALSPKRIYPSHGKPFSPEDLVKYRHWFDGRTTIPPA